MDSPVPRPIVEALTDLDLSELLAHDEWLRRLAARLARDGGEADDLVQRTWLAVLRRRLPRATGSALRGWLSRVLRNESLQLRRSEGRRREHESIAVDGAASEAPSPQALTVAAEERLALQRSLLCAVDGLSEPARSAVLQHYLEGRPIAEVAALAGVPPRTVETRLRRARQQLRARLDTRFGSRSAWLAVASPRVVPNPAAVARKVPAAIGSPSLLLIVMKLAAAAGAGLVIALGALALWPFARSTGSPELATPRSGAPDAASVTQTEAPLASLESSEAREAIEPIVAPEAPEPAALPAMVGRVFDEAGQPLAHFDLELVPPLGGTGAIRSDQDGFVTIPGERGQSSMRPRDDGFAVLFSRDVRDYLREAHLGPLLAVAPSHRLEGHVVDPEGVPIAGAAWSLELPETFRSLYPDALDSVDEERWSGEADPLGAIVLDGIPALAGLRLTVSAPGYLADVRSDLPLPGHPDAAVPLQIVLEPVDEELVVRGVVRAAGGEVVAGAYVGLGLESVTTGDDGEFAFTLMGDPEQRRGPQRLLAAAGGWQPVTFEPTAIPEANGQVVERGGWPDWIELRFDERPLEISGVVLGPDGSPRPGARVWVEDPTVIGGSEMSRMILAESLGHWNGHFWRTFETDASGRFRIPQLADREYEVSALDPDTLHVSDGRPVSAGSDDAVLRLAPSAEVVELDVLVEDALGTPIEGARVKLERTVLFASVDGSSSARFERADRDGGETDASGVCALGEVALQEGLELLIYGPGLMAHRVEARDHTVERRGDAQLMRCVVQSECEARVVDASPAEGRATHFKVLAPAGTP
ncbi:MAG: sigma-70 family RNA polymerase sigma factor, partial [Planctomycetota bacterium]